MVEAEGSAQVARLRALRTGRSSGEWIEVLDGLHEGERVVVDGHFALSDGTAVIVNGDAPPAPSTR